MSLKDAMREVDATYCKLTRCINEYSEEDVETLGQWITTGVPIKRIVAALRKEYPKVNVVEATFRLHVVGGCNCPADALYKGALDAAR